MGDESLGYLASWRGNLFRTEDGGWTWTALAGPDLFFFGYDTLAVTAGGRNVVLSVGYYDQGVSGTGLFLSGDFGESWERVDLPEGLQVYKIFPLDESHAIAVATEFGPPDENGWRWALGERILVTHDGWRTYEIVFDDCPRESFSDPPIFLASFQACQAAAMVTPDRLVVGRNDGWTFVSSDGGASWVRGQRLIAPLDEEPDDQGWTTFGLSMVGAIDFVDDFRGFALSAGGAMWRTEDGGMSWVREASLQTGWGNAGNALAALPDGRAIAAGPHFVHVRAGWRGKGVVGRAAPGLIR